MTSASEHGDELRRLAEAHAREAARAAARAADFARGDRGERVVQQLLAPLTGEGWSLLHDRRWPGKRQANVDHLLVGPGGVIVLDTKSWRGDVSLRNGRLWQGQNDVSEKLDGLAAQVADVEEALAPYGLAPLEVFGGMVFVGKEFGVHSAGRIHVLDDAQLLRWVRARGQRLGATRVTELTAALAEAASPCRTVTRTPVPLVRAAPKPRESAQASLFTTQAVDLTELERASRLPLEQWMTYLHPAQVAAVRRRYGGPSRIRGPAGCGKTVVALHRAAYLASQEPGEVLVVSYVKTLPVVLSSLYRRLSPQTASRVTFSGIHRLASDICRAPTGARRSCRSSKAAGSPTSRTTDSWPGRVGELRSDRSSAPARGTCTWTTSIAWQSANSTTSSTSRRWP